MGWVELLATLLSVVDKIVDRTPSLEDRRKNKYHKLKSEYFEVINDENIDHNRADQLAHELKLFVESFSDEIFKKNL